MTLTILRVRSGSFFATLCASSTTVHGLTNDAVLLANRTAGLFPGDPITINEKTGNVIRPIHVRLPSTVALPLRRQSTAAGGGAQTGRHRACATRDLTLRTAWDDLDEWPADRSRSREADLVREARVETVGVLRARRTPHRICQRVRRATDTLADEHGPPGQRIFCFAAHKDLHYLHAGSTAFEEAPWRPGTSA